MSNFPTNIDSYADEEDGVTYPIASDMNNVYDTLEKLETKVGVDSSAVATSHDYKLSAQGKGVAINALDSKETPVDADMVGVMDSAASNVLKKLSWVNLKATLKTYFDTQYSPEGAYIPGETVLGIADGGTGQSTAANAFTALKQAATTTATGVSELATSAEIETGTDNTRTITPSGLTNVATLAGKTWFLDSITLSQNDSTKVPSQRSVKSYVDSGLATKQATLGFTPENVANKSTTTTLGTSDALYPTQKAVKTYVDSAISAIPVKATGAEITTGTVDTKFVTPKALADATVSKLGGAWTVYTPTWAWSVGSISNGNAVITGSYTQIGKTVHGRVQYKIGTTTSWSGCSGILSFTLPVASATLVGTYPRLGNGMILDTPNAVYTAVGLQRSTTTVGVQVIQTSSACAVDADISTTSPMTWTTGDEILMIFTYETA